MGDLIKNIIEHKSVEIYFQVIISHNKKFDVGIEAFVKGIDPLSSMRVTPLELFENAREDNLEYELSTLIFEKTLMLFSAYLQQFPRTMLYFNINEIDYIEESHYDNFSVIAQTYNVPTDSIALDIRDSSTVSVPQIQRFIEYQRQRGFYICIDDIGKNYFNLDRIIIFNPDIIKINHQHLERLNNKTYYDMVLKYIAQIAHELGMIVVETGLESEEQLKKAINQGAQFFQGFYIHKPMCATNTLEVLNKEIDECLLRIKAYDKSADIPDTRIFVMKVIEFLNDIKRNNIVFDLDEMNDYLAFLFEQYSFIENGWFSDESGIQLTRANINKPNFSMRNCKIFQIYDQGHDYSDEEFYHYIKGGIIENWVTKPYISLQSNDTCVTASTEYYFEGKKGIILSVVVNYNAFKNVIK